MVNEVLGCRSRLSVGVQSVKYATVLALAVSVVLSALPPASAAGVEDVVRTNCTRELATTTDATRAEIKKFTVRKSGSGYVMSGQIASGKTVTCKTNADGRVTAIG